MAWAVLRAPRASRWFYGVTIDVIVAWPGISWIAGRIAGAL
jgi:hypothetical protein